MTTPLLEFLPNHWTPANGIHQILFQTYRVARAPAHEFGNFRPFMLAGVHIFCAAGDLHYTTVVGQQAHIDDDQRIQTSGAGLVKIVRPFGNYVVMASPIEQSDGQTFDNQAKDKIKTARGILASHFGKNIAFDRIYEQSIDLETNNIAIYLDDLQNPFSYDPPMIDQTGLVSAYELDRRLSDLPRDLRERIQLASRWFAESLDDLKIDAFLKCWFALEVIGMPDSNIKSINRTLCRLYDMSYDEVKSKFLVGRILGVRSAVVHNGFTFPIDGRIVIYMQALFSDLFSDLASLPFRRRAEAALRSHGFDLDVALPRQKQR